jgi:c-di-GMP-specific phosphodiesterase
MPGAADRFSWDMTAVLESVGASGVALWTWDPGAGRLRFTGAARALGLGPLAPDCSLAALLAMTAQQDRPLAQAMLAQGEPGDPVLARLTLQGGAVVVWRGVWLEEGGRAAGVIAPESHLTGDQTDRLTGLLDRRTFLTRARERLSVEGRRLLVVGDLDRLRRLNEALGHERADLVLAALGARLAGAFPAEALAARVGEDEFAVLVDADQPEPAERMRTALESPLRLAGFDIFPTLSIGAVEAHGGADAPDAAELLRRAELAVEQAKTAGRGAAVAYGRSLESDGISRLALEAELRAALDRGELEPFYQPIVRLRTGAIAGFEALVRWRHPRRGLVSPDDFLPLAEEMGLMPEIGRLMVARSARQLAAWLKAHRVPDLFVSVNLSSDELTEAGLVEGVERAVTGAGLPKGALKIEVTEGQIMRDPEEAARVLGALREVGASLALDDFGTGFSSLEYLTRLPFDTLKIDRYFVRTMGANEGSAKIVRSVAALGRDLALEVVAEGVENGSMARALLEMGCAYGQGFGYAPALTAQDAEVYLNESWLDGAAPLRARA